MKKLRMRATLIVAVTNVRDIKRKPDISHIRVDCNTASTPKSDD